MACVETALGSCSSIIIFPEPSFLGFLHLCNSAFDSFRRCSVSVEYIGETERPLHVRFAEHLRKLSKAELHKYQNPKKDGAGKIIIDEHEPSAVSAHAMMEHNGIYNFGIGVLSIKRVLRTCWCGVATPKGYTRSRAETSEMPLGSLTSQHGRPLLQSEIHF